MDDEEVKELDLGYTAKATEKKNDPGYWSYLNVEIFKGDTKIGEYQRNYSSLFNTFVPFRHRGKEYALYSKNYTATRVMSLPDCVDICGEEPKGNGFCPTDYYVPFIQEIHVVPKEKRVEGKFEYSVEEITGEFGFVAGCVWGDDCSWKIQYLDLSRITEGILIREEKFGYLELPSGMSLKDAINFDCYDSRCPRVEIAVGITFDMRTGEAENVHFKIEKED